MRTLSSLVLLLLAACGSTRASLPHAGSLLPNEAGRQHYLAAHGAWCAALADPEDSVDHLLAARGGLRLAQRTDQGLPLYFSQEGQVALELAEHYARLPQAADEAERYLILAEAAFRTSVERHPQWAPGHEGLAILAERKGETDLARRHRALAESAADLLRAEAQGLTPFRRVTPNHSPAKPLSADQQLALLRGQMREAQRWQGPQGERLAAR